MPLNEVSGQRTKKDWKNKPIKSTYEYLARTKRKRKRTPEESVAGGRRRRQFQKVDN